jgi:phytoene synthase
MREAQTAREGSDRSGRSRAGIVRATARAGDMDRYLSALLAPRSARADLLALTAFLGEVARIPEIVTEPAIGEIRLQWWRDAVEAAGDGGQTGNPVADALGDAIVRGGLPREELVGVIDACSEDLAGVDAIAGAASGTDLAPYLDRSDGAAFRLAARVLGVNDDSSRELLAASGQAYGRTRLLRRDARAGRGPLQAQIKEARDCLSEVRMLIKPASAAVIPAILPVALVEPYLAALEGQHDEAATPAGISQLARVWTLWKASVRQRV